MAKTHRRAAAAAAVGGVLLGCVLLAAHALDGQGAAERAPRELAESAGEASRLASSQAALPARDAPRDGASPQECRAQPEHCNEAELTALAAELVEGDPVSARALLQHADARFGERHELRRALEIEALVRTGQIGLAHARASHFYRSFPGSSYAADVERLTGYHPRPAGHE